MESLRILMYLRLISKISMSKSIDEHGRSLCILKLLLKRLKQNCIFKKRILMLKMKYRPTFWLGKICDKNLRMHAAKHLKIIG